MLNTDQFFGVVRGHLDARTPFSFVRFSDGEVMLLNRHAYYSDYIKIVSRLWGYDPQESELEGLSELLIQALQEADVTGFPTPRHLARTDFFRDAIPVYERFVDDITAKTTASVDVAWEMLAGSKVSDSNALLPDYFEELLRDANTLNYVSCWNLDQQFKDRYGVKNVNSYILAGEPKFTSKAIGAEHQYPHQFNRIHDWIGTLNCTGQLCLVGGGVFSKMYNTWFKEQGGVSLDVGSVMDGWKGRSTRGKTRGLDVDDLTYKL